MNKIISAKEALKKISDHQTVAILGSGGGICEPTFLLNSLGNMYQNTGAPKNLTLLHANGIGDKNTFGTDALAYEGLVKRDIAGHWGMAPKMAKMAQEEKIEAYNLPQGVISQMYQSIAGNKPGVITKTGLNTFIDPRIEGGKMNKSAKEDLVKIINIDGEEWLHYPNINIDVALVRGTTADENGNITYEEEAAILDGISIAQAAKNSGGIVIAQVKNIAKAGSLKTKDVVIPGIYVDYIVVDSNQPQTCERMYDPALAGNVNVPVENIAPLPLDPRKVVARRAAKELRHGMVINLGVGMPSGIAAVAAEEGYLDQLNFTVEQGIIGGMPIGGVIFGVSHSPEAMIDQTLQFNFYDGGGLDIAFLGMAQMDRDGNVNSSKTGALLSGCGGAINISQNAKKVVFCGTFTAKGFKADVGDGKISLLREGDIKKIVEQVDQITFSGTYARKIGQPVLYITERAVFELAKDGVMLTEIAPGMDLEKDILAHMDFKPIIAKELKKMDSEIFIV
ncbi:MAG TPA: malonate decarboxylase subunit alpha [Candidatus Pelethocola excrementipullorum]|nr:malonate decarboxylase subunit alpha [Candidatus Pelethocola excrementipullorum]